MVAICEGTQDTTDTLITIESNASRALSQSHETTWECMGLVSFLLAVYALG
jgi:hypothetical protein